MVSLRRIKFSENKHPTDKRIIFAPHKAGITGIIEFSASTIPVTTNG